MAYMENPKSSFPSIAELEASGLVVAGWLPGYLPRSAYQIEERHNIDTNVVWASFRYKVGDIESVESKASRRNNYNRIIVSVPLIFGTH